MSAAVAAEDTEESRWHSCLAPRSALACILSSHSMETAGNSQPYYLGAWLAEQHACYIGDIGTETVAAVAAVVVVAAVAAGVVVVAAAVAAAVGQAGAGA